MGGITKTERLLGVFHLFRYCREVSFKEVTDQIPVSKKTVYRDIRLLKQIGYRIDFSRERRAFVISRESSVPRFPENKTQRKYLGKILRLTAIMAEMSEADDPVVWYRDQFPELSVRTMQRDFATLNAVGYRVIYERESYDPDYPTGKYRCEWPDSTYSLELFYRGK
ncbi:MAG: helix-turn-helix domain-containing protein [Synergistaceae bacterium]|jgi:predicted DNA-binding transcriptional regulator YafY|nr:helix-turn-helix domain-containing protein [Synergistaceae bacterium]